MSFTPRLNRLFAADGKCFEIAVDHGVHNEWNFLSGIENMQEVIGTLAQADPDAILLSTGQARWLQEIPGKAKPALTLRADPTNLYENPTPRHVFCQLLENPVEQALALDAASLVVNLLWAPDQPELYHQCLQNVCQLKPACERYGIPLMVEPLVLLPDEKNGGYKPDADIRRNVALVRQAVELGADIIKAESFENLGEYHKIIEAASGRPVLPRGGSRIPDREILRRTHALMKQGAAGIVYGRNVFQHPHPVRMAKACKAIVHRSASVEEALQILEDK
jgi:DhnA family fructose-bisphosphate aldolase class Ia